jgi:aminomethyltransferase
MSLRTVLHDAHVRLGARLTDFGGWDMPVQYDGILAEHQRVRQDVGMFDTCHMDAFGVAGPGALDFLSRTLTQDLRTLADGRCRYGFLLRDDGGLLDDLIAYRFAADRWMLVVNAGTAPRDFDCMRSRLPGAGVLLEDLRDVQGKIDVQGPNSADPMKRVLGFDSAGMGYFSFRPAKWEGADILVSRTGYTGEYGFEIYAPVRTVAAIWEQLLTAGVKPCGLGARDTLRLDAGLPLYGHELREDVTPVEAGMMKYASKAEPFAGRDALRARQTVGPKQKLVGFAVAGRQSARHGNRVLDAAGAEAGRVTSGSFSPTLGHAIGFAYVRPELAAPGAALKIDLGSRHLDARVVPTPFYRRAG